MMIYSIARMSFTFALTLVARTSVNVVKTCTLLMENAEVICQLYILYICLNHLFKSAIRFLIS